MAREDGGGAGTSGGRGNNHRGRGKAHAPSSSSRYLTSTQSPSAQPQSSPSTSSPSTHPTTTTTTTTTHESEDEYGPYTSLRDDGVDCLCRVKSDDGFSIMCDDCSRWCHSACFGIGMEDVPEKFKCWECWPRAVDRGRAVRMQRERERVMAESGAEGGQGKRRTSPGVDRKHRRTSAAAIEGGGGKRKRRPSMVHHPHPEPATTATATTNGAQEDEHVDIDEPWTQSYIHINHDIIADTDTRLRLRRHAHHWRGITAVSNPPPPTQIKPLPPHTTHNPLLSPHPASIMPPTYTLHTAAPVPSSSYIAPYYSRVTPSAAYLKDPLNGYAHLGAPKPYVHLLGPPLEVCLDARGVGGEARFVRSGCRPNAVIRPVVCGPKEEGSLGFGVFALRDLKANEEIVLGWEWDDGNAVHNLPALLESPSLFP
ncbi:hypothetical protein B0H34DRAFT_669381 [Crassisporium funariophilum]|nr:hypothetical protein B0H34DRAFT_669381 [Crassisporium funariophilum]